MTKLIFLKKAWLFVACLRPKSRKSMQLIKAGKTRRFPCNRPFSRVFSNKILLNLNDTSHTGELSLGILTLLSDSFDNI